MERILLTNYVLCNNKIHYFDNVTHIPGNIDVDTGKVSFIANIKGYEIGRDAICCSILKEEKMYALQNKGDAVLEYDLKNNECKYISIPCENALVDNVAFFCEYEENLFIFPRFKNEVLYINTKDITQRVISLPDINSYCGTKIQRQVWLFPRDGNYAKIFDLETKSCRLYDLNMQIEGVFASTVIENKIYLLNTDGIIYVLDPQSGLMEKILALESNGDKLETPGKILAVVGKVIALPAWGDKIKILNTNTHEVELYDEYPEDFMYYSDIRWTKYIGITEDDEFYYLLGKSNYMLKINKNTGGFLWKKIILPERYEKEAALYSYGKVEFAESNCTKEQFVSLIQNLNQKEFVNVQKRGNTIWERLRY